MANHLRIGYVPQFRNVDIDYPLSVRNFVSLNLLHNWRPWLSRKERSRVKRVLKQADLEQIADRPLGLASGGEKQRAYLAQALLNRPQLLILDESTASLDNEMKFELLDLVSRFQQNGLTVIFITHDMDLAQRYGTRYLMMKKNGYESGPINELNVLTGGQ
jgi:zinc/manganese transport system ATP-binding protein